MASSSTASIPSCRGLSNTQHTCSTGIASTQMGNTSYYRRWGKEHKTPICEFGETVLYMLPTAKHMPKMEARFYPAIWLGKDNSTNENILGISSKVVKARTIRRQIKPDKYNKQLMDIINSSPAMIPPTAPSIVVLPQTAAAKQQTTTSTQTQQSPQPKALGTTTHYNTTSTYRPSNGNSASNSASKASTSNANTRQERSNRRDYTRQLTKASKDNRKSHSSQPTWHGSGATNNKDEDLTSHSHNEERTEDRSNLQRRWTGDTSWKDSPGTLGEQHRRFRQGTNNRRNETRNQVNEGTRCIYRSTHQPTHPRNARRSSSQDGFFDRKATQFEHEL